jgi:superfamily II DNA/RNA helicase
MKCNNGVLFSDATFKEIGVSESSVNALSVLGFTHPTHIQKKSYRPVYEGNDVIIGSETGSGKTLAYLLPLVDLYAKHDGAKEGYPSTVVLAPNVLLCNQIESVAKAVFRESSNIKIGIE